MCHKAWLDNIKGGYCVSQSMVRYGNIKGDTVCHKAWLDNIKKENVCHKEWLYNIMGRDSAS